MSDAPDDQRLDTRFAFLCLRVVLEEMRGSPSPLSAAIGELLLEREIWPHAAGLATQAQLVDVMGVRGATEAALESAAWPVGKDPNALRNLVSLIVLRPISGSSSVENNDETAAVATWGLVEWERLLRHETEKSKIGDLCAASCAAAAVALHESFFSSLRACVRAGIHRQDATATWKGGWDPALYFLPLIQQIGEKLKGGEAKPALVLASRCDDLMAAARCRFAEALSNEWKGYLGLGNGTLILGLPNPVLQAIFGSSAAVVEIITDGSRRDTLARLLCLLEPQRAPVPPLQEDVQFTVYRPQVIVPGRWYPLLAFAHLTERPADAEEGAPDPLAEVARQAEQALGPLVRQYQSLVDDSSQPVPRYGEITFRPDAEGIEFNPPSRSFFWTESVHREEFRLRASHASEGQTARGRLAVFLGSILLAEFTLRIRVNSHHVETVPEQTQLVPERALPYRKIFASYSHQDLWVVQEFERVAASLGDTYLRDWVHLRAGEHWDERLLQMIEDADVFQLFWSSNSMHSPFVRREWQHALSLARPNFVRPTYWEQPLPCAPEAGLPPAELQRLHFHRVPLLGDSSGHDGPAVVVVNARRGGPDVPMDDISGRDASACPVATEPWPEADCKSLSGSAATTTSGKNLLQGFSRAAVILVLVGLVSGLLSFGLRGSLPNGPAANSPVNMPTANTPTASAPARLSIDDLAYESEQNVEWELLRHGLYYLASDSQLRNPPSRPTVQVDFARGRAVKFTLTHPEDAGRATPAEAAEELGVDLTTLKQTRADPLVQSWSGQNVRRVQVERESERDRWRRVVVELAPEPQ